MRLNLEGREGRRAKEGVGEHPAPESDYLTMFRASRRESASDEAVRTLKGQFAGSLDARMNFDSVFRVVRKTVLKHTGRERPGVGLALADLPNELGAYWEIGGNYIVMNSILVGAMRRIAASETEYNSFVYTILAHEYIHSLGFVDEADARRITAAVAIEAFGPEHPAAVIANGDIWTIYPVLRFAPSGLNENIRFVENFDIERTSSYIR